MSRIRLLVLPLAIFVLSSCAGKARDASVTRAHRAVWCPSGTFVLQPTQSTTRVSGSRDARTLIGEATNKAAAEAREHGCTWRVVKVDGRALNITLDGRRDRIDALVKHGTVTAVAVY